MNNSSLTPQPKIAAAGAGGAASILVVYLASLFGLEVTAEAASAFTTLVAFAAGYLKS